MSSFLADITNRDVIAAASHTARFAEARARMVAENVANLHTPGYRTKTLDVRGFQRALREALTERGGDSGKRLAVRSGGEVATDASGRLAVTPGELPVHNLLMHDGTNQSIERQMADLAETGAAHELATLVLRDKFDGLRKAIRGTVA